VTHGRVILKTGRQVAGGVDLLIHLGKSGTQGFLSGDPQFIRNALSPGAWSPRLSDAASNSRRTIVSRSANEVIEVPVLGTLLNGSTLSVVEGEAYSCIDGTTITLQVSMSKFRNGKVFDHVLLSDSVQHLTSRVIQFDICP
ncbi:MAG: hypothetical protein OYG31_02245, partial [Candidatus Kaiserbacteria bacterium]|nr:hypothetical protein [Candidatus Kaiserbacteria bacterium]